MPSLQFTERMAGHWQKMSSQKQMVLPYGGNDSTESLQAFNEAETATGAEAIEFTLTIKIDDVAKFVKDPKLQAIANGSLQAPGLGVCAIENGQFNLFTNADASDDFDTEREMHYTLFFKNEKGTPLTFFGYKSIKKEDGIDAWHQTTTLYSTLWSGHYPFVRGENRDVIGAGILHIAVGDFMHQLTTFKSDATSELAKAGAYREFLQVFAGNLWQAYAPFFFDTVQDRWANHEYPMFTTIGVIEQHKELHPFSTNDGLNLTLQRFKAATESKNQSKQQDVILLLHGLTNATDMFIMPEHQNLVNFLHNNKYSDVWSLDWRGSGRFTYNLAQHRYTLDDVAADDIPCALAYLRAQLKKEGIENPRIHAICHCVGSMTLMMSVAAGLATGLTSIVSNSVSLTPQIREVALAKIKIAPFIFESIMGYPYVSPAMPYDPGHRFGKIWYHLERLIEHECTEPACHMISFMWGWGSPAAYEHANIHPVTHRRLPDLFGGTSFNFHRHILKMIAAGGAVTMPSVNSYPTLANDYVANVAKITLPPLLLMSGDENHIFPGSNKRTFDVLQKIKPQSTTEFFPIPGYGHQDPFIGLHADRDVFPRILQFLDKHSEGHT